MWGIVEINVILLGFVYYEVGAGVLVVLVGVW